MRRLLLVTAIACGRTEPHDGAPATPERLCQAVMGTPQVQHIAAWPVGACLDVTFEGGAEAQTHTQKLHGALLEWAAAPDTWLCFNAPMPGSAGGRAVHVQVSEITSGTLTLT